ncbi:hypothetical protein GCM10009760_63160 [Kitasatospora kazusensis]|uniref:Fluoride-specific ion channel FluC n=1 Tax=Kitasatospora kazusensis TaxID=407974 RepID=A0ABN1ZLY4_9ACTN
MATEDDAPPAPGGPSGESPAGPGDGRPAPRAAAAAKPRTAGPATGVVVAVVSAGGVLGACARYGAGLRWPTAPGTFPWTTLGINVLGCLVIGAFLTVITELRSPHPLVRPFFGTGVLGGFTTFSTYTVDVQHLTSASRVGLALLYLAGTLTAAMGAVWAGAAGVRLLAATARRPR